MHTKVALSSQEGSITMVDRPSSSSGASQGDGSLMRPGQDSPRHSARHRHVTTWSQESDQHNRQTDQQVSTSSGLDNDKRLKGKYLEQMQTNDIHDKLQKRFKVFLDECRIYLNDILERDKQNEVIEMYKQEFQKLNESGQKEYIETLEKYNRQLKPDKYDDEKQVEIDKKLGYLLKNKDEELKNIRMSVLKFIGQKIENESNKREILLEWNHAINDYCTNHDQLVTENVYRNVIKDAYLCYEANRSKITKNAGNIDYKENNRIVYDAIIRFNGSLYTEQERSQVFSQERSQVLSQENQEQERQDRQDLLVQQQEQRIISNDQQLHNQMPNDQQSPERDNRPQQPRQQTPEQRLAELRGRGLQYLTSSQIGEYSEGLLQQMQRHRRVDVRLRDEAHRLHAHLDYLRHPGATRVYAIGETRRQTLNNIERATQTTNRLRQELQEYAQRRQQTRGKRMLRRILRMLTPGCASQPEHMHIGN